MSFFLRGLPEAKSSSAADTPSLAVVSPELASKKSGGMDSKTKKKLLQKELRKVFNAVGEPLSWRVKVPNQLQTFRVVTTYIATAFLTASSSSEVDTARAFQLSQMNSAELAGLAAVFDQFQISRIEVMLLARGSSLAQTSSSNSGLLATTVDYDSANASTIANLITYQNSILAQGVASRYHSWVPSVSLAAGGTGGTSPTDTVMVAAPWLDLQSGQSTQHYGFKASISTCDAAYVFDLAVRYHLLLRQKI